MYELTTARLAKLTKESTGGALVFAKKKVNKPHIAISIVPTIPETVPWFLEEELKSLLSKTGRKIPNPSSNIEKHPISIFTEKNFKK